MTDTTSQLRGEVKTAASNLVREFYNLGLLKQRKGESTDRFRSRVQQDIRSKVAALLHEDSQLYLRRNGHLVAAGQEEV